VAIDDQPVFCHAPIIAQNQGTLQAGRGCGKIGSEAAPETDKRHRTPMNADCR